MKRQKLFLNAIIKYRFQQYDDALKETEAIYLQQSKEVLPFSETELNKMNKEEREEIMEWYADDYFKYTDYFPRTLRNSFFVGYYSLFEFYLNDICIFVQKNKQINFGVEIIKGNGIFKSREYLVKVCQILFTDLSQWNEILHINKLRNSMVHNLGQLEQKQVAKLQQYIQQNNTILELDSHNRILIKNGFLKHVSKIMQECLIKIINLI